MDEVARAFDRHGREVDLFEVRASFEFVYLWLRFYSWCIEGNGRKEGEKVRVGTFDRVWVQCNARGLASSIRNRCKLCLGDANRVSTAKVFCDFVVTITSASRTFQGTFDNHKGTAALSRSTVTRHNPPFTPDIPLNSTTTPGSFVEDVSEDTNRSSSLVKCFNSSRYVSVEDLQLSSRNDCTDVPNCPKYLGNVISLNGLKSTSCTSNVRTFRSEVKWMKCCSRT